MDDANLIRWHERLGRAATLIAARLDDPPSLDELAAAAAISPFHLHRVWRGLTGETVRQSIARLRVEAVQGALGDGASVTAAAMAAGFASSQSFTRAFRRTTGQAPSRFVADGAAPPPTPIRIVLRDATTVVALRREGGAYVALNALFQQVWDWADAAGRLDALTGVYGVPLDDPASMPEAALRYDACLAVGEAAPPAPLRRLELPAGSHAMIRHVGGYDAVPALSQRLVGEWLPRSGREPADAPLYHHFIGDPDGVPAAELVTEILLPLKDEGE